MELYSSPRGGTTEEGKRWDSSLIKEGGGGRVGGGGGLKIIIINDQCLLIDVEGPTGKGAKEGGDGAGDEAARTRPQDVVVVIVVLVIIVAVSTLVLPGREQLPQMGESQIPPAERQRRHWRERGRNVVALPSV